MGANVRSCSNRTTDPFNQKVRARIFTSFGSSSSSGSEHDAETDIVSPSSSSSTTPCLSHLVQNFLECSSPPSTAAYDPTTTRSESDSDSDSDTCELLESDPTAIIHSVIHPITLYNNADPFRFLLLSNVTKAIEIFSFFRSKNKSIFNRNIMSYLREIGYNAGICKTKWDSSKNGTLTAGNYEFIDVLESNSQVRYIIDAEFCDGFEIARETENYRVLRASIPRVFVGKVDDLKKIIRLICDEARRSMKINGLTLPPWRRNRYMQMKWLESYRRTTNCFATNEVASKNVSNCAVKCRSVGFNVAGDKVLLPPLRLDHIIHMLGCSYCAKLPQDVEYIPNQNWIAHASLLLCFGAATSMPLTKRVMSNFWWGVSFLLENGVLKEAIFPFSVLVMNRKNKLTERNYRLL